MLFTESQYVLCLINIINFITNRINNLSISDLYYLSTIVLLNFKTNPLFFYKGKELIALWHECTQFCPCYMTPETCSFIFVIEKSDRNKTCLHSINFIASFSCPWAKLCQFSWKIESSARICLNNQDVLPSVTLHLKIGYMDYYTWRNS